MRHHAIVGADGKLLGYVTHGDLTDYAQRNCGTGKAMAASDTVTTTSEPRCVDM